MLTCRIAGFEGIVYKGEKTKEELMDWTRRLTEEETREIIEEAEEKQRRDRVAHEDYIFNLGVEEGLRQVREKARGIKRSPSEENHIIAINLLKKQVNLSLVAQLTGLSIEKLEKLKKLADLLETRVK